MITQRITLVLITLSFLFFVLFGCARRSPRIETQPLPEIDRLLKKIAQNQQALRDFEGFGRLLIHTPSVQQAFGIHAYYQAPDAYKITFLGIFGIEIGSLTIVGDEYSIKTLGSAKPIQGNINEAPVEDVLGPAIHPENLIDLVKPLMTIDAIPQGADFGKDIEEQMYSLTWEDGSLHQCWIAPYKPIIARLLLMTQGGDTLWFRDCQNIKEHSGVTFPEYWEVVINHGEEAQRFQIKFSSLRFNRGLPKSLFRIES